MLKKSSIILLATLFCAPSLFAEQSLIQQLTGKLGVTEKQAQGGAGSIFKYVKDNVSSDDFGKIAKAVPDMDQYLGAAPKSDGLGGLISGALGGDAGGLGALASLAKPFSKLGMDEGMVAQFMPIIIDYIKAKGGDYIYALLGKTLLGDNAPKEGGLISKLTGELGVEPEKALLGAGAIFGYVKDNVSEDDFSKVAEAVPSMKELLGSQEKEPEEKGLGGLSLGNMVGKIDKPDVLGTDVGKTSPGSEDEAEPEYMGKLKERFGKLGLDPNLVEKYLPVILGWVKTQGAEYASGVLGKLFTQKE